MRVSLRYPLTMSIAAMGLALAGAVAPATVAPVIAICVASQCATIFTPMSMNSARIDWKIFRAALCQVVVPRISPFTDWSTAFVTAEKICSQCC